MHPTLNYNHSFPCPYLFQSCGLPGGSLKVRSPFNLCNSQHLKPLMAFISWFQPAMDLVMQTSLLYFHLPYRHCGQPLAASQVGSLGLGETARRLCSFLSPSTLYWLRMWDSAPAFLPSQTWCAVALSALPRNPILCRPGACPAHGLFNLGRRT